MRSPCTWKDARLPRVCRWAEVTFETSAATPSCCLCMRARRNGLSGLAIAACSILSQGMAGSQEQTGLMLDSRAALIPGIAVH